MIPLSHHESIIKAVQALVIQYGHPDEIPVGELSKRGVPAVSAEKCEALLTSEDMPKNTAAAVAKWMRLIAEFTDNGK
jgi:hypothetical protein